MSTNLFGGEYTTVGGTAQAGRGEISLTIGATTTTFLAANLQVQYSQQVQPKLFAGGYVFAVRQMAQGQLSIGAVMGPNIMSIVAAGGADAASLWDGTAMTVSLTDPSLSGDDIGLFSDSGFTISSFLVQDFNLTSNPPDPPVMTNISIWALNISSN